MNNQTVKFVVFVPEEFADLVREAIARADGGHIGDYSCCTFSSKGVSRFRPLAGAKPKIGQIGRTEEVIEERIELICERSKVKNMIVEIRKVHPYEEIAFDVWPLIFEDEL